MLAGRLVSIREPRLGPSGEQLRGVRGRAEMMSMIRLQRDQNWDQPLQCPQVFDGRKKDVEVHGEARARKQTRELRQELVCLGSSASLNKT